MKKIAFLLFLPLFSVPAHAWWPQGHSLIAASAVETLPSDVPSWFRKGEIQIAHCAQDPDVQKSRDLPLMTEAEGPQHYLDWELLQGKPLPPNRKEFDALCAGLGITPDDTGELPYAIAEWTERLTMTFAEARKWPNNKQIQTKALVYAGILSHYTGDATMPLHTTVNHDGRVGPDGKSPRTGIHAKVDSLIEKISWKRGDLTAGQIISPLASTTLLGGIESELKKSQTLVDRTYELESQLPPATGSWTPSPQIRQFTLDRARAGTRFTATLFLTAWRNSEKVTLPTWLVR